MKKLKFSLSNYFKETPKEVVLLQTLGESFVVVISGVVIAQIPEKSELIVAVGALVGFVWNKLLNCYNYENN